MRRLLLIAFVALQCTLSACSQKKAEDKPVASTGQTENEYPPLALKLASGEEIEARSLTGNNVFVLFQPDCSHCQEEAVQIEQHLSEFKDYKLYFISSAAMNEITAFAKSFNLDGKDNVKFAWTPSEGVLTYYGPIPTPSIYIYTSGKLRQSFKGQTEIDNIIKAL